MLVNSEHLLRFSKVVSRQGRYKCMILGGRKESHRQDMQKMSSLTKGGVRKVSLTKEDEKGFKREPPSFFRVKGKEGRNIFSPPRFCLCSLTIKQELLYSWLCFLDYLTGVTAGINRGSS